MAKLSSDGKYVTVERGDTLSQIAVDYAGGYSKYKQLAAINSISDPNLIYVGQKIYLTKDGSGTSTSTSTSDNSNKPKITHFGVLSTSETTLFATWDWSKDNTESYKVVWTYDTGDSVWFSGNNSTITIDKDAPSLSRQSTYSIPSGAKRVQFKVKPLSEKKKKNNKEVDYWTAEWSDTQTWTDATTLEPPDGLTVEIKDYTLTATIESAKDDAAGIEFEIVKDNKETPFKTGKATVSTGYASYSCTVSAGGEYKVRCRAYKGSQYSEWTEYSGNYKAPPAKPAGIKTIRAESETSVYLEWDAVSGADTYGIEYATKKEYFDGSDQTSEKTGIEPTNFIIDGLETGQEYFFRINASAEGVNDPSPWSDIKSIVIGTKPSAPTTWSSTTTAVTGEEVKLYWIHNTEDGSSQTYARVRISIKTNPESEATPLTPITIQNTTDEDTKDDTRQCIIDTATGYLRWTEDDGDHSHYLGSELKSGASVIWEVQTAGVTEEFGDYSTPRTIDIYAKPDLDFRITDSGGDSLTVVTGFPFYAKAIPSVSDTQLPLSYHVDIISNSTYETVDNVGNQKTVVAGDLVYSKYFDIQTRLLIELSAGNIDLENGVEYTAKCIVSMDSGLTAEGSFDFTVKWADMLYSPNVEIGIDYENMTASLRPYCEDHKTVIYKVSKSSQTYTRTNEVLGGVYYERTVKGATTTTGEPVYLGTTDDGVDNVYYTIVTETTPITDVNLSVYRREFDGSFTELATGLDGAKAITITDPHPALDYARYRIVAISKSTGAVSYYDPPGYPVGGTSVIIQWDEEWTKFDTDEEAALVKPPWTGSMLKLPYNIDVTDKISPDVELIEYVGRSHPVSYYGTQLGQSSTWTATIPKSDKDTIYALRRLARWMGDVYVREPSGTGYWANVNVSSPQKHGETTIQVSLTITRVEGGA